MSDSLILRQDGMIEYTQDQVQLIKDTICKDATDDELKYFMYMAKKTGLDAFAKQLYSVARWDSKLGRNVRTIQASIDGFRVIAERSHKYAGQLGPYWLNDKGEWLDYWIGSTPPLASKVGVLRSDFKEPLWAVAKFESYAQKNKDGSLSQFWKKMPELMIAKVAESLALRKAFPQDLSGIYTTDEMAQADNDKSFTQVADTPKLPSQTTNAKEKEVVEIIKTTNDAAKKLFIDACKIACEGLTAQEKASWLNNFLKIPNMKEVDRMTVEQIESLTKKVKDSMNYIPPSDDDFIPVDEEEKPKSVKEMTFSIN